MKRAFLKEGDVIELKKNMTVYADMPSMFVFSNRKLSRELTRTEVKIDNIYKNNVNYNDCIKGIIEDIVKAFDSEGQSLKRNIAKEFVLNNINMPGKESFILESGEFVVIKTNISGGGTGMGPHDVYPDGHFVTCKRLKDGKFDENGTEVDFYQSGCFTAMIEDISPIRKLKAQFV